MEQKYQTYNDNDIAIIGMSCRFPGADSVNAFWDNLKNGTESITFFTDEELAAAGISRSLLKNPKYVKASGILDSVDGFDAYFFDYSPKEASLIDPQHRLFLEQAWKALEDAGYNPDKYPGMIGVYAGTGMNTYLYNNLQSHANLLQEGGGYYTMVASDKDFLATRISYKLNLNGPSMTIQTACSTSLVAVHQACQSIRAGECDMALAGGVSLRIPQRAGYLYQEGIVLSPDGHCRAFDAKAGGTVIGNGAGVVVLKLLSDALAEGDQVYAVIKGSALNNDGSLKAGYTAPGLDRQAAAITEALAVSDVAPDTIDYVETHGTGTPIGDPIEIKALNKAYGNVGKHRCAVGSVKTNIGHLDAAAGVAGLIKTALCLRNKQIPASLNFEEPNPKIDFANSPFYVNTGLQKWEAGRTPRRAGLSSFGIGGTNAHAVLEEAPQVSGPGPARPVQILTLSAKTESALKLMRENLANCLSSQTDLELADMAYTQNIGRKTFKYRFMLTCRNREEAVRNLQETTARSLSALEEAVDRPVAFLFPGQGAQYVNMGWELYNTEPTFKGIVDECCDILRKELDIDLRTIIFPQLFPGNNMNPDEAKGFLNQTLYTQPALFVIEYALAKLWMEWGLQPQAMVGHSIGEYTAACLAGVFSLQDALYLVARRGSLMNSLPRGSMLMVALPEEQVIQLLDNNLSIAAINGSSLCVVSGQTEDIAVLEQRLAQTGVTVRRLHTSHAFHSAMMEPILPEYREALKKVTLRPPQIPCVSNLSGRFITPEEATDPEYWVKHLRQSVRFADGLTQLLAHPDWILLEVGPGRTLSTLANRHPGKEKTQEVLNSLPNADEQQAADEYIITALGRLWLKGARINWNKFYRFEERRRVSLPTYPFERQRYWFENGGQDATPGSATEKNIPGVIRDTSAWYYLPSWKRVDMPQSGLPSGELQKDYCIVFCGEDDIADGLIDKLTGTPVITVRQGENFTRLGELSFAIRPSSQEDYLRLLTELKEHSSQIGRVIHMWSVDCDTAELAASEKTQDIALNSGFYSILYLLQALGQENLTQPMDLVVVTLLSQEVLDEKIVEPVKTAVLGTLSIIPFEYPNISCRSVDLEGLSHQDLDMLYREITSTSRQSTVRTVAFRRRHRWVRSFEQVMLPLGDNEPAVLRKGGVYLITGGTGGIGMVLATYLADKYHARLVLTTRSEFPPAEEWQKWLENHTTGDKYSGIIRQIRHIEEVGGKALVLRADVSDRVAMASVFNRTIEQFGAIHGVFHAAGVEGGGMIQTKSRELSEKVLAPKIKGALILKELLSAVSPDFMVLFSSINTLVGRMGQFDYSAANTFLNYLTHTDAAFPILSIGWDTWREAGMAANPVNHPLVDHCLLKNENQAVYLTRYEVAAHWVLNEHGIMGKATIPGTTYLEMAMAAFGNFTGGSSCEMTDVHFYTPLVLSDHQKRDTFTVIKKREREYQFYIVSRTQTSKAQWIAHADGSMRTEFAADIKKMKPDDIVTADWKTISEPLKQSSVGKLAMQYRDVIRGNITVPSMIIGATNGEGDIFMEFGPRWQCLHDVKFAEAEGLACFELDSGLKDEVMNYTLHPALLDFATSFLRLFTNQGSYLPYSYKKLKVYRALPAKLYSYAKMLNKSDDPDKEDGLTLQFDLTIFDAEGNVCVTIEEFSVMKVKDSHKISDLADLQELIPFTNPDPAIINDKLLLRKELFEENLNDGLSNDEGIEALLRILSGGLKEIIVSKQPIEARIANNETRYKNLLGESAEAETPALKHPRPNLAVPYAPARDEAEKAIVHIWEEALGIENVGIYDNFFDLGGDSLLIAQVHSKFKEKFEDDISVANLLQFPSVAELVQYMKKMREPAKDELSNVKERTDQQRDAMKKRQEMMKSRLEAKK